MVLDDQRYQRSRELALRLHQQLLTPESQPPVEMLFFKFDRMDLALPASRVRQVLSNRGLVRLPGLEAFCEGVVVKDGIVLPVFIPWPRMEDHVENGFGAIVWIQGEEEHAGVHFGWLVDSIGPFYRRHELPEDLKGLNQAGVPLAAELIQQTTQRYQQYGLVTQRK